MNKDKKLIGYPMKELVPIIKELIGQGKEVILTARGSSMRPMVKNVRDAIILSAFSGEVSVGDVILYERKSGGFVLHRVVEVCEDNTLVLMGDFQHIRENGIEKSQIIAVLSGIIRKDKTYMCSSPKYQRYAGFWTKSKIVRRLYIATITLGSKVKNAFKKQS